MRIAKTYNPGMVYYMKDAVTKRLMRMVYLNKKKFHTFRISQPSGSIVSWFVDYDLIRLEIQKETKALKAQYKGQPKIK